MAYLRETGRSKHIATITGPSDTSGGIGRLEATERLGDEFDEGSWPRAITAGKAASSA